MRNLTSPAKVFSNRTFQLSILILTFTAIFINFHPLQISASTSNQTANFDEATSLIKNSSFEEGFVNYDHPFDQDPRFWRTVEGETARGTGRETNQKPELVQVLCDSNAPISPPDGNCLLKIKSSHGVKADIEQSIFPIVIDGTFSFEMLAYIPEIPENKSYTQQFEIREGNVPGAAGQVLQVLYAFNRFTVCTINECKKYPPISKNVWHKFKVEMTKKNDTKWSLVFKDNATNKTYWNSLKGQGGDAELKSIPRERISPQIGAIFIGDECLGNGGSDPNNTCDGSGTIFYDQVKITNPNGTGRFDFEKAGDANGDNLIDAKDLAVWHANYIKTQNGQKVEAINRNGDFRFTTDYKIDGLDYALWWARTGQNTQE